MKNEYGDTNKHFHHQFPNPFQHQPHQTNTTTTFDQDDNTSSAATTKPLTSNDGATIKVVRRPRGRPPGSKNKSKTPIIINQPSSQPSMSPYILQLPAGADIVSSLSRFSSRDNIGLVILTASGTVSNVTLRQPSSPSLSTVTFHGRFEVLSISATFLPNNAASRPIVPNGFTISLAGPQGQIVGGIVAGELIAAGSVYIMAASFNNPTYQRLPVEEDDVAEAPSGGDGGEAMYSSQLATDIIWAPTARQPPPPY